MGDFLNISVSQIPSEHPKTHSPDTCPLNLAAKIQIISKLANWQIIRTFAPRNKLKNANKINKKEYYQCGNPWLL